MNIADRLKKGNGLYTNITNRRFPFSSHFERHQIRILQHTDTLLVITDGSSILLARSISRNQLREIHAAGMGMGIAAAEAGIDFGNIIVSVHAENIHIDGAG